MRNINKKEQDVSVVFLTDKMAVQLSDNCIATQLSGRILNSAVSDGGITIAAKCTEHDMNSLKNYLLHYGYIDSSIPIYADEFR